MSVMSMFMYVCRDLKIQINALRLMHTLTLYLLKPPHTVPNRLCIPPLAIDIFGSMGCRIFKFKLYDFAVNVIGLCVCACECICWYEGNSGYLMTRK